MNSISQLYKNKTLSLSNQINTDITLKALKLSPVTLKSLVGISDRFYDCVRDVDGDLIDIGFKDNRLVLIFEPILGSFFKYELEDLSLEDKIYLLELIENLS